MKFYARQTRGLKARTEGTSPPGLGRLCAPPTAPNGSTRGWLLSGGDDPAGLVERALVSGATSGDALRAETQRALRMRGPLQKLPLSPGLHEVLIVRTRAVNGGGGFLENPIWIQFWGVVLGLEGESSVFQSGSLGSGALKRKSRAVLVVMMTRVLAEGFPVMTQWWRHEGSTGFLVLQGLHEFSVSLGLRLHPVVPLGFIDTVSLAGSDDVVTQRALWAIVSPCLAPWPLTLGILLPVLVVMGNGDNLHVVSIHVPLWGQGGSSGETVLSLARWLVGCGCCGDQVSLGVGGATAALAPATFRLLFLEAELAAVRLRRGHPETKTVSEKGWQFIMCWETRLFTRDLQCLLCAPTSPSLATLLLLPV